MSTIPQLGQLKTRLNQLNIQKARYGISADPHIEMEASDLATVVQQMELIDIQRRNLDHLIGQRSTFGASTPPHIANQIITIRAEIQRLRAVCARLGQNVPSHPVDDDEPAQPLPPIRKQAAPEPQSDIRAKLDLIERLINDIRNML